MTAFFFETIHGHDVDAPAAAPSRVLRGEAVGPFANSRVLSPFRANAPAAADEPVSQENPPAVAGNEFIAGRAAKANLDRLCAASRLGAPGPLLERGNFSQTLIDIVALVFCFLFGLVAGASVLASLFIVCPFKF
jgi:hypothetical protein